jgi:hypothetical protein
VRFLNHCHWKKGASQQEGEERMRQSVGIGPPSLASPNGGGGIGIGIGGAGRGRKIGGALFKATPAPKPRPVVSSGGGGAGAGGGEGTGGGGENVQEEALDISVIVGQDNGNETEMASEPAKQQQQQQQVRNFYGTLKPTVRAQQQIRLMLLGAGAWLAFLSIVTLFHVVWGSKVAVAPVIDAHGPRTERKNEHSFVLVPDAHSKGRFMTVALPAAPVFAKLKSYHVCCTKDAYFVCGSATRNLGVEAYMTNDGKAVVQIAHADMVGASCTLLWLERLP